MPTRRRRPVDSGERRRNRALQHGGATDDRHALRLEHRGPQPRALRAEAARPPHREPHHRRRRHERDAGAPEPAHPVRRLTGAARRRSPRASPSRPTWSSRPTARRSTSRRSAPAWSPPSTRLRSKPAVVTRTLIPVGDGPSGLALDAARDRLFVMNRLGHGISVVTSLSDPKRRAATALAPAAVRPVAGQHHARPPLPLRRGAHLRTRRRRLRELPRLRRLRRPGVGPGRPLRPSRPEPESDGAAPARASVPSHEGSDGDAEPARHGRSRRDALARRSHRRRRSGRRRLRRGRRLPEVQPCLREPAGRRGAS